MSLYLGTTLISPNQPNSANQSLSNINSTAQENIVDLLYPVGSIYIGTTAQCPLSAIKGTWTLVSSGRVLQGADSNHAVGTTAEAGLPNITGDTYSAFAASSGGTGALNNGTSATSEYGASISTSASSKTREINFNASLSNPIYGNSTTVQPPAYFVNIWERTA